MRRNFGHASRVDAGFAQSGVHALPLRGIEADVVAAQDRESPVSLRQQLFGQAPRRFLLAEVDRWSAQLRLREKEIRQVAVAKNIEVLLRDVRGHHDDAAQAARLFRTPDLRRCADQ